MQRFGVPWHIGISIAVACALAVQAILLNEAMIAKRRREQAATRGGAQVSW